MSLVALPIRETNTVIHIGRQQAWTRELHALFDRNGYKLEETSRLPSGGLTRDLYERTQSGMLSTHKHFKDGILIYELINEEVSPGTHVRTMLMTQGATPRVHEDQFFQNGRLKERHRFLGSPIDATRNRRYNVEGSRRLVAVPGAVRRIVTFNANEEPITVRFFGELGPLLVVYFTYTRDEVHEDFYEVRDNDSRLAWRRVRTRGTHGDLRIVDHDPSGQIAALQTFTYNTRGDLLTEEELPGEVLVSHEYRYDERNNWSEHMITASNGHYERRQRTLTYYEVQHEETN